MCVCVCVCFKLLRNDAACQRGLLPPILLPQIDLITTCSIMPVWCLYDTREWYFFSLQGRHVKTGQLAAIKVMDVTGVRAQAATSVSCFSPCRFYFYTFKLCLKCCLFYLTGWGGGDQSWDQHAKKILPPSKHRHLLWCLRQEEPTWHGWPALGQSELVVGRKNQGILVCKCFIINTIQC